MSDMIDVLEVMGSSADFAGVTPADLGVLMRREGMELPLALALLESDGRVLRTLLRAPDSVCCLINPAEPDEDEEDDEDDEEDEESNEDDDKSRA